jgi:hypothetical protein
MVKKILNPSNSNDLNELRDFIDSNPNGCKNFRYFSKRNVSVINNHIFTCLYYDDNSNIIGYGHLDKENDRIWLGVMVSDTQKLKGYGGLIVDDLISQTSSSIYLSVDNNNEIAKNLYKKKNFVTVDKNDKYKIMCREKI